MPIPVLCSCPLPSSFPLSLHIRFHAVDSVCIFLAVPEPLLFPPEPKQGGTMLNTLPFPSLAQLPEPVLTVCLDTNHGLASNWGSPRAFLSWFQAAARQLLAGVAQADRPALAGQLDRVERFLREQPPPTYRGLALFAGPSVWHSIPLQVEPQNQLHWGKPLLWQLCTLADQYPPACIAVVDLSGVKIFGSRMGEITPLATADFHIDAAQWKKMEAVHAADNGIGFPHGAQRDLFERRRESQYLRFLSGAAQQIALACEAHGLTRIYLLGADRLTRPLERKLPRSLRAHATCIPHGCHGESPAEILLDAAVPLRSIESEHREQRVLELVNRARGTVTGPEETLAQLQRSRLRSLLVADDFNPILRYCPSCAHAAPSAVPECPHCRGEQMELTLHEILPQLLDRYSCELTVVREHAAERLRSVGGIGGWLCRRRHTPAPGLAAAPVAAAASWLLIA